MATFKSLGLNQWLCDQLKELNVRNPTPVQENCIPEVLAGRDVLGCSKTVSVFYLEIGLVQRFCFF